MGTNLHGNCMGMSQNQAYGMKWNRMSEDIVQFL